MESAKGVLRELLSSENVVSVPVVKKEKVKLSFTDKNGVKHIVTVKTISNQNSETSDVSVVGATELVNEPTSDELPLSEQPAVKQAGGSIFRKNNTRSDGFSTTSELPNAMVGGGFQTSDTLNSISEIKERRRNRVSKSSETSVDLNIFKRGGQSGGSIGMSGGLKQELKNIGINSSSTSDLCE
jgi:hypothetical protein